MRFRIMTWISAVAALTIVQAAVAQTLVMTDSVPAPEMGSSFVTPLRCDAHGDIFLRPPLTQATPNSRSQPPITKISSDGKRAPIFFDLAAAAADGLVGLSLRTFAVSSDGALYVFATTKGSHHPAVVKFDNDGHYSGSTILDVELEPQQLAVFADGTFLAAGVVLVKAPPNAEFAPYLAIFDRDGRLVKTIDARTTDSAQGVGAAMPRMLALDITASDGSYVYLVRQGASPTVFVISPAGVVDRTLKLWSPDSGAHITGFWVANANLLVEYSRRNAMPNGNTAYDLVQYDSQTGDKLTEYAKGADPKLGGSLACTDWQGDFTFLSTNLEGKPVLVKPAIR